MRRFTTMLLAGFITLTSCSVLEINVDVYKGPLSNSERIQVEQVAVMAVAAKPLLTELRDKIQALSEVKTRLNRANELRCNLVRIKDHRLYSEDHVEDSTRYTEKLFKAPSAIQVNEVLSLYEDRGDSAISTIVNRVTELLAKSEDAVEVLFVNEDRDEALNAELRNRLRRKFRENSDEDATEQEKALRDKFLEFVAPTDKGKRGFRKAKELVWAILDSQNTIADIPPLRYGATIFDSRRDLENSLHARPGAKFCPANLSFALLNDRPTAEFFAKMFFASRQSQADFANDFLKIASSFLVARETTYELIEIALKGHISLQNPKYESQAASRDKILSTIEKFLNAVIWNGFNKSAEVVGNDNILFAKSQIDEMAELRGGGTNDHPALQLLKLHWQGRSQATNQPFGLIGGSEKKLAIQALYGISKGPTDDDGEGDIQKSALRAALSSFGSLTRISRGSFDKGRLDSGLETLIEAYLVEASENPGSDRQHQARNTLLDALARFAEKVTRLANNTRLINPSHDTLEYVMMLQVTGYSILTQVDELVQAGEHRNKLKQRCKIELKAMLTELAFAGEDENTIKSLEALLKEESYDDPRQVIDIMLARLSYRYVLACAACGIKPSDSYASTMTALVGTAEATMDMAESAKQNAETKKKEAEKFAKTVDLLDAIRSKDTALDRAISRSSSLPTVQDNGQDQTASVATAVLATCKSALNTVITELVKIPAGTNALGKWASTTAKEAAKAEALAKTASSEAKSIKGIMGSADTPARAELEKIGELHRVLNEARTNVNNSASTLDANYASLLSWIDNIESQRRTLKLELNKIRVLLPLYEKKLEASATPKATEPQKGAIKELKLAVAALEGADQNLNDLFAGEIGKPKPKPKEKPKAKEGAEIACVSKVQFLKSCIAALREYRSGFVRIRPAAAFLRNANPIPLLQDNASLAWYNRLEQQAWRQVPVFPTLFSQLGKKETDLRQEIDKQFWVNVNRVRVSGAGTANYALIKDDIGNWSVKGFSTKVDKIVDSMKSMAKFHLVSTGALNGPATKKNEEGELVPVESVVSKQLAEADKELKASLEPIFSDMRSRVASLSSEARNRHAPDSIGDEADDKDRKKKVDELLKLVDKMRMSTVVEEVEGKEIPVDKKLLESMDRFATAADALIARMAEFAAADTTAKAKAQAMESQKLRLELTKLCGTILSSVAEKTAKAYVKYKSTVGTISTATN